MPSKKKKYNARFPAGRIKKIMQTDEEVGKVAQAVPVIISRTLELFVESLLTKTLRITNARNAKTLSPSHMKQCIMSESRFDFLRELVKNIPDITMSEEMAMECSSPGQSFDNNSSTSAPPSPTAPANKLNVPPITINNGFNLIMNQVHPNGGGSAAKNIVSTQIHHSNSLDGAMYGSTSSSNCKLNFYKENENLIPNQSSSSSVIQHTSNHNKHLNSNSIECSRPPKLARYDSAPSNLYTNLSTSNISYTDSIIKASTPNIDITKNQPIFNIDLTKNFFNHTVTTNSTITTAATSLSTKSSIDNIPDLTPILKIDLSNSFTLPSTSKNLPSPPVIKNDVCNTPIVKIDYSKIVLTTPSAVTSPIVYNSSLPSSSASYPSTSNLSATSTLINYDLTNLNKKISVPTTPVPANNNKTTLEMDEDYDNL